MQWVLAEQPDRDALEALTETLRVPKVFAGILLARGVHSLDEAKSFFKPDWDDLYDPFLMKDMDKAVDRITLALDRKERIFIFGDYDVDGITSVSLLYLFLTQLGLEVFFYIPDRLREGYGLSAAGVQDAVNVGATLMLTVDCGITGQEEIALARQHGIDVIVSDHHEPGPELPDAVAILDPKRKDCAYPFKELAGVGVAFKLCQAVAQQLKLDDWSVRQYVDLVALGSAADIVPLVDENRLLVKKGLEEINSFKRVGIRALIESSGQSGKKIGTGQIVFILAPRINAVGRMGNAERAVRLLITESEQQAKNIAGILESENRNRKTIDEETFQEALKVIEAEYDVDTHRAVVLAQEGWHAGVIGIVASRIAEQIHRPTVMIAVEDGIGKGSARSVANFDIFSALKQCEHHLLGFGGHRYAAGLSIALENLDAFRQEFQTVAAGIIEEEDLEKKLWIDAELNLTDINDKFIRILNYFSPFGPRNMRPVFVSHDLQVVGSHRIVGRNHLKFKVRQQRGQIFDAIGFNLGDLAYRLAPGETNLDLAYVIEENYWNGQTKIQLRVKDLR